MAHNGQDAAVDRKGDITAPSPIFRKIDVWYDDDVTPFQFTVKFRGGVVVGYDPAGNLP